MNFPSVKYLSAFFYMVFALNTISAQIPAFPGAQGFGALQTTGGRGGHVLYVTNLNCDGLGSLNEALATPGPKYILFKVSGVIDCAASVEWGDCYIAGQTSPGGIIVRGIYIDDWYDPNNGARNIILRHLNSRPNTESVRQGTGWVMDDALRLDGASRVVVDHCSFANATDEQVQISRSNNICIQHCMLAEPVGDHYMFGGMLLNYSTAGHHKDSISIHHNLWNRVGGRMPEISCEQSGEAPGDMSCLQHPLRMELSNNLLWDQQIEVYYNSGFYPSDQEAPGLQLQLNMVNNRSVVRSNMCNAMFRILMLNFNDNELFTSGNTMSSYPNFHDYELFNCCNDFCNAGNNPNTELGLAQRRNNRFPFPDISYTSGQDLLSVVLNNVGAHNCHSPGQRDPMNRRLLQALQSQTIDPHPVDGEDYFHDAYKLDFTSQPLAPVDSDGDGMPDDWESSHGLNPSLQDHNGTQLSVSMTGISGYTNLECYLNALSDKLISGACGTVDISGPVSENLAFDLHYHPSAHRVEILCPEALAMRQPMIEVVDSAGKIHLKTRISTEQTALHVESLASGLYFIRLSVDGRSKTKRIAIN